MNYFKLKDTLDKISYGIVEYHKDMCESVYVKFSLGDGDNDLFFCQVYGVDGCSIVDFNIGETRLLEIHKDRQLYLHFINVDYPDMLENQREDERILKAIQGLAFFKNRGIDVNKLLQLDEKSAFKAVKGMMK